MAEYEKKVRKILKDNGCSFVRHGKGEFDYTKWQSTYFGKMEPEEFNEAAARYAKEHPYTGNAKVIL